ncbi:MAG: hypothetical protein OXP74_07425 [Acidobacteriota bacterium]|nr:hypothetical protein [Acidobacteriota bacterium]
MRQRRNVALRLAGKLTRPGYPPPTAPALPGERGGWSVYRVVFADGAAYVGITKLEVADRLAQHLGLVDSLGVDAPPLVLRQGESAQ